MNTCVRVPDLAQHTTTLTDSFCSFQTNECLRHFFVGTIRFRRKWEMPRLSDDWRREDLTVRQDYL
ncbi:hypothetical protein E2C01_034737 [Portunus trituberculatus]|uniref:Uncharacterized protein n=1 Tax=Portunus trituberculatus TaxID=210409 RepID=A0A5B7F3L2_PORTR|nr:hypothetical protein [Portunus trituberculatus]